METKIYYGGNLVFILGECPHTTEEPTSYQISEIEKDILDAKIYGEVWTKSYINALPSAAFALIQHINGVEKRSLPHHNKNVKNGGESSSLNISHLHAGLSRVNQVDAPAELKNKAKNHLQMHMKQLDKNYKPSK